MKSSKIILSHLRVRGYRSCKDTSADFEHDLTALIGQNGAGKTNLLHAIRLVRLASRRGYFRDEDRSTKKRVSVELTFCVGNKQAKYRCSLSVRPTEDSTERVTKNDEIWNFSDFKIKEPWIRIEQFLKNPIRGSRLASASIALRSPLQSELHAVATKSGRTIKLPAEVRRAYYDLLTFQSEIDYYSASRFTNPSLCPTSFELDEKGNLSRNYLPFGSDHQQFLYDLFVSRRDRRIFYSEYLDIVGAKGLGLVEKIAWKANRFPTTATEVQSGGELIRKKSWRRFIIPTVTIKGNDLSFNQLSEGTFRTLALVFYVMRGGAELLLLEEPEVCIHHGLLHDVISIIKEYSKSRQIIMSTHANSVVDMLEPENLRLVRDTDKGTTVRSIAQQMSAVDLKALQKYLHSSGSLGEYWQQSGFDQ